MSKNVDQVDSSRALSLSSRDNPARSRCSKLLLYCWTIERTLGGATVVFAVSVVFGGSLTGGSFTTSVVLGGSLVLLSATTGGPLSVDFCAAPAFLALMASAAFAYRS